MIISTMSGPVKGSGRSRYMWWLKGWVASQAWSGAFTVQRTWESVKDLVEAVHDYRACYACGYTQGTGYQCSRSAALTEAAGMLAEARVERARADLDAAVEDHQLTLDSRTAVR